jgi:hypothetical protein
MRVSMIIKSHLNDTMVEMDSNPEMAQERLRFVKYLIHMFPDTDEKIDVDVVYEQFKLGDK